MIVNGIKVHPSVTPDRLVEIWVELGSLDNPGICIACGEEADGCEPDAREYTCAVCDQPAVYGMLELSVMI